MILSTTFFRLEWVFILLCSNVSSSFGFIQKQQQLQQQVQNQQQHQPPSYSLYPKKLDLQQIQIHKHQSILYLSESDPRRRQVVMSSSLLGGIFGNNKNDGAPNAANPSTDTKKKGGGGKTNEIVRIGKNGMKLRRLGNSDIIVSELGLGTQRWISGDYNSPDKEMCYKFLDKAILQNGVNFIDTAEQYPIPSDPKRNIKEGDSERLIGTWMKERKLPRENLVIGTKITGGRHITPRSLIKDCDDSLQRLQTDYIDIYQLHWPQRYSPQANWGQSLEYNIKNEMSPYWRQNGGPISFEELCTTMEQLIQNGKIRGWGLCNDNAYGLTACTRTAKFLGCTPPVSIQGDYSLIDRKSDENGVAEAASPYNENVGFMSYNALAGGMLTGKYTSRNGQVLPPPAVDDSDRIRAIQTLQNPRGRMDTRGWGSTLYRYRTDAVQNAIVEYEKLVQQYKLSSLTELALRWNKQRTLITTTLVGHTNIQQLDESLKYFTMKESLSDELLWDIDCIHMRNRLPMFSSNRIEKDWYGEGEIGETIP